jgi:hypothetical protein
MRGDRSLDDLKAECDERTKEISIDIAAGMKSYFLSNGIKLCVRYYDADGSATKFIRESEEIEYAYGATLMSLSSTTGWRKIWQHIKFNRLAKRRSSNERRRIDVAVGGLTQALSKRAPVGVEDWEHRYRPLRREEAHELVEAARASKSAWLFLFSHNDLLADKNKCIVALM